MQLVTGHCFAHQWLIINLVRGRRDFDKKFESLIDLVVLHVWQNKETPSDIISPFSFSHWCVATNAAFFQCWLAWCKQSVVPQDSNYRSSVNQRHLMCWLAWCKQSVVPQDSNYRSSVNQRHLHYKIHSSRLNFPARAYYTCAVYAQHWGKQRACKQKQ